MIDGIPWRRRILCKVCNTMKNLMVVSLKTKDGPSNREDVIKQVLTVGSSDAKRSLQPKFERC